MLHFDARSLYRNVLFDIINPLNCFDPATNAVFIITTMRLEDFMFHRNSNVALCSKQRPQVSITLLSESVAVWIHLFYLYYTHCHGELEWYCLLFIICIFLTVHVLLYFINALWNRHIKNMKHDIVYLTSHTYSIKTKLTLQFVCNHNV